jgi:hypothetical protein
VEEGEGDRRRGSMEQYCNEEEVLVDGEFSWPGLFDSNSI